MKKTPGFTKSDMVQCFEQAAMHRGGHIAFSIQGEFTTKEEYASAIHRADRFDRIGVKIAKMLGIKPQIECEGDDESCPECLGSRVLPPPRARRRKIVWK